MVLSKAHIYVNTRVVLEVIWGQDFGRAVARFSDPTRADKQEKPPAGFWARVLWSLAPPRVTAVVNIQGSVPGFFACDGECSYFASFSCVVWQGRYVSFLRGR